MNIACFLIKMQDRINEELDEIEENFHNPDLLYKIRKHILSFSSFENAEKIIFSRIEELPMHSHRVEFINLINRGNANVWRLYKQLSELLTSNDFLSIKNYFSQLRDYEKMHIENTVKTYFPYILKSLNPDAIKEIWDESSDSNRSELIKVA